MRVQIADLKARLGEHLRSVKRGQTIDVLDRKTLVARIVPAPGPGLTRRSDSFRSAKLTEVPLPPPLETGVDILTLLEAERGTG